MAHSQLLPPSITVHIPEITNKRMQQFLRLFDPLSSPKRLSLSMRVITFSLLVLLAALLQPVCADWQYHSRPDLSPPKLNITVRADSDDVESGLIFVAPYQGFEPGSHGPAQPGAYIFRDNGDLVWSGLGYFGGWTANFRPDVFNGKPMLRATQGLMKERGLMHGNYGILDDNYKFIKSFQARSHHHLSVHEFLVQDDKTVLIESPIPTIHDLKPYGGEKGQNWILAGSFQGGISMGSHLSQRLMFSISRG